jgi:hypothetical protein
LLAYHAAYAVQYMSTSRRSAQRLVQADGFADKELTLTEIAAARA